MKLNEEDKIKIFATKSMAQMYGKDAQAMMQEAERHLENFNRSKKAGDN